MKAKTRILPVVIETAMRGYLAPRLAHDARLDLGAMTRDITAKTWKADKGTLKAALLASTAGKMARDADLGDVVAMLDQLDDVVAEVADAQTGETLDDVDLNDASDPADQVDPVAADPSDDGNLDVAADVPEAASEAPAGLLDFLTGKLSDDDLAQVTAMFGGAAPDTSDPTPKPGGLDVDPDATDALPLAVKPKAFAQKAAAKPLNPKAVDAVLDTPQTKVTKDTQMRAISQPAMDAAIRLASDAAVRKAEASILARLKSVREAEKAVRPWVGEIAIAQDSAEAVYRLALDSLGIDTKGVREIAALELVLAAQPKPGEALSRPARVAMDSSAAADLARRFPGVNSLKRA